MVKVVSSRYTEEKCKMKKPYIICHMMTSVDGRIDCAMTSKLSGVSDYYTTLAQIWPDAADMEKPYLLLCF